MLSKSLLYGAVLAFSAAQVAAHAAINPLLGLQGQAATRDDVRRPSNDNPCDNVDIASNIDKSTPAVADASGAFTVEVENFNG